MISSCSLFSGNRSADRQITNAVTDYIAIKREENKVIVLPIPEIYFSSNCIKPMPPMDQTMLEYEVALKDALVSFKECRDRYTVLTDEVVIQNDKLLNRYK